MADESRSADRLARYDLENIRPFSYDPDYQLVPSEYGDWVKFEDAEKLLAEVERLSRLRDELETLKDAISQYRHTPEDESLWSDPATFVREVRRLQEVNEEAAEANRARLTGRVPETLHTDGVDEMDAKLIDHESRSPDGDGQTCTKALIQGAALRPCPEGEGPNAEPADAQVVAERESVGVVTALQGDGRLHGSSARKSAAGSEPADSHTTFAASREIPALRALVQKWREHATSYGNAPNPLDREFCHVQPSFRLAELLCADELDAALAGTEPT